MMESKKSKLAKQNKDIANAKFAFEVTKEVANVGLEIGKKAALGGAC